MAQRMKRAGEKVRVAMIGAGGLSTAMHYPSLSSFDDVTIEAVCDIDVARRESAAAKFRIQKQFTDYRKMIEELDPDAVYAVGPPHHFYDIWVWCLEHGINLCVQKPLALTMHQSRVLAELADRHGCITQTGFQRRASPIGVMLRNKCLERGPIVHAVCRFYKWQMTPMRSALDRMLDDGVHVIDTLRWACGGEVVKIDVQSKRVGVPDVNFHAVILGFDNGSTGVMLTSWASARRIFHVEMHAPGICAEVELEGKGYLYADGNTAGKEFDAKQVAGSEETWAFTGFRAKDRQFIDGVKTGSLPESHFGDAAKTMEVAHRVLAKGLLGE